MRLRTAFTLVELLIVIAINAVLLGLLVAAVQRARDAAARVTCATNLRDLGLALHHHHDSMQSFPAGMRWRNGTDRYRMMSWLTHLLPHIGQDNLWLVTEHAYKQSAWPLNNPPHIGLSTLISTYHCPSDARVAVTQLAARENIHVALTSYLGIEGKNLSSRDGILFRDSRVRIGDITHGTSQTLLAGERPPSVDFQFGWSYAGAGQAFTGSADSVLGVEEENILPYSFAPCIQGVYRFSQGHIRNQCDMFHFWSLHPGGANFLFADGSVHFLSYSAAPIMPALAARNGGEVASIPD